MINSHTVIINADIEKVFQQALLWGEAEWWPKDCLMRYTRLDNSPSPYSSPRGGEEIKIMPTPLMGEEIKTIPSPLWGEGKGEGVVQVGTRYHQKVLLPFAPEWDVEVISITQNKEVTRRFLNGIFSGTDSVILEPLRDGVEVKAFGENIKGNEGVF
ncbi:MAG: hypothetical protein HZC10_04485 [Nitrospirae bacterium]|nr:hypothetical protein [Nitrospirota bacterium]